MKANTPANLKKVTIAAVKKAILAVEAEIDGFEHSGNTFMAFETDFDKRERLTIIMRQAADYLARNGYDMGRAGVKIMGNYIGMEWGYAVYMAPSDRIFMNID